jgi:hypothetical protein
MRTKTLLSAVAALAVGITASMAQTYSQNIVGYVTQVLPIGYNLVAVPLNATNVGSTVPASQVLSCLQGNDSVILWNGSGYSAYLYTGYGIPGYTWQYPDGSYSDTDPSLTLGQGFFYQNGQLSGAETNTFTGTVVLSNTIALPVGFNMVASTAPIGGATTNATFNLPIQGNDSILIWTGSGYSAYLYTGYGIPGYTWQYPDGSYSDTPPSLTVGQGFFYQNGQLSGSESWQQTVVVQ